MSEHKVITLEMHESYQTLLAEWQKHRTTLKALPLTASRRKDLMKEMLQNLFDHQTTLTDLQKFWLAWHLGVYKLAEFNIHIGYFDTWLPLPELVESIRTQLAHKLSYPDIPDPENLKCTAAHVQIRYNNLSVYRPGDDDKDKDSSFVPYDDMNGERHLLLDEIHVTGKAVAIRVMLSPSNGHDNPCNLVGFELVM